MKRDPIKELREMREKARESIWAAAREIGPKEYRRLCGKAGRTPSADGEANFVDGFAAGLFASRKELHGLGD